MEKIIAALCVATLIPIIKKIMAGKLLTDREYFVSSILFFPVWLFLVNFCLDLYHESRKAEGLAPWPDWVYGFWEPWERAFAPFVDALFLYPVLMMVVRFTCCTPLGTELEKAEWLYRESLFFVKVTCIPFVLFGLYVYLTKWVFS